MNPEQKLSLLREILNLSESRAAKIQEANNAYQVGLRQSLDRLLGMNGVPADVLVDTSKVGFGMAGIDLERL